jgi:hypothetical protein
MQGVLDALARVPVAGVARAFRTNERADGGIVLATRATL